MRRFSERAFVIVLLLVSMHLVSALLNSTDVDTETSNAIISTGVHLPTVIAEMAMYLWCIMLMLPRWRSTFTAVRAAWPILLLPALAILSSLWSINPMLTLRRSTIFTLSTLLAIYLGERFTIEEFSHLFAQAQCWFIAGSIAMYFVFPEKVLDPSHTGAWRGLTVHKNVFGECMAVAVLLLMLVRFKRHRILQSFFFGASILMLYLSHSITPTISCGVVILAIPIFRRIARLRIKERVFAYAVCGGGTILGVFLITSYSASLLPMLGRNSTLSGRAQLWSLIMDELWKRPLLGYGYEAFWEGFKGASRGILESTGWLVPMAHNGYLETLLSIGMVGLLVYGAIFLNAMSMAVKHLRSDRRSIAAWPIAYLCFFALHNTAESTMLTRTTFEFLVFVQISVALQQAKLRERIAAHERVQAEGEEPSISIGEPALGPSGATV